MSFTHGFEKVAGISNIVGQVGAGLVKGTAGIRKGVSDFAVAQRADRLKGYRSVLSGKKGEIGGVSANRAIDKLRKNPTDLAKTDWDKAVGKIKSGKQQEAMSRLDRMKSMAVKKDPFYKRHPYLTAAGVYLGAKSMMGSNEPPPPPPQVVQY